MPHVPRALERDEPLACRLSCDSVPLHARRSATFSSRAPARSARARACCLQASRPTYRSRPSTDSALPASRPSPTSPAASRCVARRRATTTTCPALLCRSRAPFPSAGLRARANWTVVPRFHTRRWREHVAPSAARRRACTTLESPAASTRMRRCTDLPRPIPNATSEHRTRRCRVHEHQYYDGLCPENDLRSGALTDAPHLTASASEYESEWSTLQHLRLDTGGGRGLACGVAQPSPHVVEQPAPLALRRGASVRK